MKRKKILAISIVCVLLIGGGSVGGAAYYKKSKNEKRVVNVTPVVNMMGYDYGSEKTIDGTVITGSKQNVMLEKNQVVQSVLVKKGDKVKVGTPLIAYDTTALKLAVQEKRMLSMRQKMTCGRQEKNWNACNPCTQQKTKYMT